VQAGRTAPEAGAALRAFDRLRDQREARTGEWTSPRAVGFQRPFFSQRSEAGSESSL